MTTRVIFRPTFCAMFSWHGIRMLKGWHKNGEWVGNVMHKMSITDMNTNDWKRSEALRI